MQTGCLRSQQFQTSKIPVEKTRMKQHSAWLAAGLLVFAVLACNFSAGTNSSGPISKITMAKDNGGRPGDETNTFHPGDHKVYCVVTLNEPKEGTKVTFVWWIVDAGGTQNEKIKELDFTTDANVKVVNGNLSLERDWPSGKYKVEAQINGKTEKSVNFTVD
jgi:hypothetical protein